MAWARPATPDAVSLAIEVAVAVGVAVEVAVSRSRSVAKLSPTSRSRL
jgi:hypothetical protein